MGGKRQAVKKVPNDGELFSEARIILPTNEGRNRLKRDQLQAFGIYCPIRTVGAFRVLSRFNEKSAPQNRDTTGEK